jgi:hypothetical protein
VRSALISRVDGMGNVRLGWRELEGLDAMPCHVQNGAKEE